MKNLFLMILLATLTLTSCEYSYDYTYEVTNNADSEIQIELKTFRIDSTYVIEVNETKILFITEHGIEGSKGPYFDDVSADLEKFNVIKNDTLISNIDYLDNSSWNFDNGVYSATITNSEFE